MPLNDRKTYLFDALGARADLTRVWMPPRIAGEYDPTRNELFPTGAEPGYEEHMLSLLRKQFRMMNNVRRGWQEKDFPFSLSPRFAFEFSAMLTQAMSVYQTYGLAEFIAFMIGLREDDSIYAKFLVHLVAIFSARRPIGPSDLPVPIVAEHLDLEPMSAIATWCMLGCSDDGELVYPERRLGKIIEAIYSDFDATFPKGKSAKELLHHFDKLFSTKSATESIESSSRKLKEFLQRAKARIAHDATGMHAEIYRQCISLFEGVLLDREKVVAKFLGDHDAYLKLYDYCRSLPTWPQCPLHLDFWPSSRAMPKRDLERLGAGASFNIIKGFRENAGKEYDELAGDVMYQSFFPGGTAIALQDVLALRSPRTLFDFLFDPEQTSPDDEEGIRTLTLKRFGKSFVRVI